MTKEQLQFFMDEVLTLFDYGEEEAERGVDPLDFVRKKVKEEREWAKIMARKIRENTKEIVFTTLV